MIRGLSHLTVVVRDLDRTERLLVDILGAERVYDSGPFFFSRGPERFFTAAGLWIVIMQGDPLPEPSYNHIAFQIDDADYQTMLDRIAALGLVVTEGRTRVAGEGRSIYFNDWDNHLFELHTGNLPDRLFAYAQLSAQ